MSLTNFVITNSRVLLADITSITVSDFLTDEHGVTLLERV